MIPSTTSLYSSVVWWYGGRHRLATFSGPFEVLTIALQHVAENMQTEAETESDEVRRAPGMAGTVGMDVAIA